MATPGVAGAAERVSGKSAPPYEIKIVGLTYEDPESLLAHPRNPKIHPKAQTEALDAAMTEVGILAPVLINDVTQHCLDGHDRIGLWIARGQPMVPVLHVNVPEEKEGLVLATFDPIGAMAVLDQPVLDELIAEAHAQDKRLVEFLASIRSEQPKVLHDDDADLTPPVDPITKTGDLWLLGEHRLLCGDATKADDVARLMNGSHAAICLTDPPYNVGIAYGSSTDDKRSAAAYQAWSKAWFDLSRQYSTSVVITVGMVNLSMWFTKIEAPYWVCSWRKSNQQSPSALRGWNGWEPLLVYGQPHKRVGQDAWDIPIKLVPDSEHGGHPVPKSLEAWSTFQDAFTESGDLVFDPFLGSGTTLIAAEQLGRRCFGLEISPQYCDVIVRRWETLTGLEAQKG